MQTAEITIQGQKFTIPAPYAAGHVLDEAEASVLNQTYGENIRNNFATRMKTSTEKNEPVPGQAELDEYTKNYRFGVRPAGAAREVDPVKAEAKRIIKAKLIEAYKNKNVKIKDLPEGHLDAQVQKALETRPEFLEQARKVVEARQGAASSLDDLLGDEKAAA